MNQEEFERIILSRQPVAAHLVNGLIPDFDLQYIENFTRRLHPDSIFQSEAGRCVVYLSFRYCVYTLYTTAIIRTDRGSGEKVYFSRFHTTKGDSS